MLKKLIQTLKSSSFIAECPHCSEELELKETEIFQDDEFSPLALEWYEQQLEFIREKKAELKELKEKYKLTVLMAEQNFKQAMRIADHGHIIVHGEIVFNGDVDTLMSNDLVKSYYLGVSK